MSRSCLDARVAIFLCRAARRLVSLLALAGCASSSPAEPPADASPVSCDAPVGGVAWDASVVESEAGFDEELAATDIASLPAEIDVSGLNAFEASVAGYALESELGPILSRDETLLQEPLGRVVLAAIAKNAESGEPGIDLFFLRRGLHRYYACSRGFPANLAGFRESVADYREFPSRTIDSMPKSGPRRLYESDGLWVAETLVEGEVRETEIVLAGTRADGALDFAVYGADGRLMDRSEFATASGGSIVAAAPYTCMTCHVNAANGFSFDVVFPDR